MTALITTVLLASLFGSLHCVGMCGPLVALYVGGGSRHGTHVAYNLGRLVSYTTLGAIAGALGQALDRTVSLAGVQRVSAYVAVACLIAWAVIPYLPKSWLRRSSSNFVARGVSAALRRLTGFSPVPRAGAVGVLSALLPCGWLYAFVAAAAGTGSALYGGIVLAGFWVGTVPAMVFAGYGADSIVRLLRARRPWVTALLLVSVGVVTLAGRSELVGLELPAAATDVTEAEEQVHQTSDEVPPCCRDH